MGATFANIGSRMRLNLFSRNQDPEPAQPGPQQPSAAAAKPPTGKTFPADEVVWGIVIRNGFDELDDPWYHRGTTQHAYLEGNDNVSICGFRPPQSGPRSRRRSRLGLPTSGEHPMCGSCARMVVAPRPRVPVPVQSGRPPVAVPVAHPTNQPVAVQVAVPVAQPVAATAPTPAVAATAPTPASPTSEAATKPVSPWVRNRTDAGDAVEDTVSVEFGATHDSGLLDRGVHSEIEQD
jgi:hypothetical protein